jgi:heme-degrading monooxygenase HmoA
MSPFANTPEPPYYAVIFSSRRTPDDDDGYGLMAQRMVDLAAQRPAGLGAAGTRGEDGFGITVSYWSTAESIARWKQDAEHLVAQQLGKAAWYEHYELRVARVERAYGKR